MIEDCAQAHGARYKGKPVGSFGDAATFSFCQDKIMTTCGEGGILLLRDADLWKKAWSYKDHGKNPDILLQPSASKSFKLVHDSFGTNWRMTEIQAAVGRIQLRKLDEWVTVRRRNADILTKYFEKISAFRVTKPENDYFHSYYKYYVFIVPEMLKAGVNRDAIISELQEQKVSCFSGSCPEVYLEKAFVDVGLSLQKRFKVAKELGETSLMFLVHPTLTEDNMCKVGDLVNKTVKKFVR